MPLSPTVKSFLAPIILAVPTVVAVLLAGGTVGPLQVGRARSSVISVKDLDGSLKFYSELGFTKLADTELSGEGIEKVWGLERGTRARMVLLQHDGAGESTTGLVQFTGTGKPASGGLFLLSFPVENVEKLFKTLAGSRVAIVCPPTDTDLPPYGQARIATVRSPDGLLLEFVQWKEKTVDRGSQAAVAGNLERGRKTFVEQCSVCHKIESPKGSGPPGLKGVFRQTQLSSSGEPVTEANVKKIILEGRPGMPRIFLEEQQLKDLLAYLKTL